LPPSPRLHSAILTLLFVHDLSFFSYHFHASWYDRTCFRTQTFFPQFFVPQPCLSERPFWLPRSSSHSFPPDFPPFLAPYSQKVEDHCVVFSILFVCGATSSRFTLQRRPSLPPLTFTRVCCSLSAHRIFPLWSVVAVLFTPALRTCQSQSAFPVSL